MSWKDIVNKAECRVSVCNATACGHNINLKCSLPEVTISENGSCLMYTLNPLSRALPDAKYVSNFPKPKQSLIDRATRNLNEEKRNR